MSLDTVLKIGNALRNAPDSLRYFKYVSPCPTDKEGNYPFCISIPVLEDFSFDWNNIKETPENQRSKLYYLRFKTSNSDGLMKYIYGDIYYSKKVTINKKGNSIEISENGGYRLEDPNHSNAAYRSSSFNRGNNDYSDIIKSSDKTELFLSKFRNALNKDLSIMEAILANISAVEYFVKNPSDIEFPSFIMNQEMVNDYKVRQLIEKTSKATLKKLGIELYHNKLTEEQQSKLLAYDNGKIFIHFEFPGNKQWYDYKEDFELINKKMLSDFVDNTSKGLVFKKTLYKTLCSGDKKNDIQFPSFKMDAKYKSKFFSGESVQDLFYAVEYSERGKFIPWTNVKIIILPHGKNLSAEDYINFQKKGDEEIVNQSNINNQNDEGEPLFDIFEESKNDSITSFDVIFSKKGTNGPDIDLSEISGLEKSNIRRIKQRIANIASDIYQKRKLCFTRTTKDFYGFRISSSFKNILGNPQADNKTGKISFKPGSKYESHMLKVLPLIYTDSYYQDGSLLSEFIQNVEYSIRAGDSQFNFLKFDLEFLISIQNNKNNRYMDIIDSNSYQIGLLLGSLAKNFAGDKSPIKSFEKNYVGNLSRRISTIDDFVKLKNDIEQKLIMHEKTKFTFQMSYELSEKIKTFEGVYDKEEAVFGFFESYFKPLPKKKEVKTEDQSN